MSKFSYRKHIARGIAEAFHGPTPDLEMFLDRMEMVFGAVMPWMPRLYTRVFNAYHGRFNWVNREKLVEFICREDVFLSAYAESSPKLKICRFPTPSGLMNPEFHSDVPAITDLSSLKTLLGIQDNHLNWFANTFIKQHRAPEGPLQHYHYKWVFKKNGAARLIEIPKYRLKEIQRSILKKILGKIPSHDAAHGFVTQRSCLTNARFHTSSTVILKMDLKDFFLNIRFGRIQSLFKRTGYPESVSRYLAGLCTNATPMAILQKTELNDRDILLTWETRKKYNTAHLPQGAPSSPALSNLCAFKTDLRLKKAALKAGAVYTRYADDLVFSGGETFFASIRRFHDLVCRIIHEEGFSINHRKTRLMKQGVQQKICGIVVNEHPNIDRKSYDDLKALLYNCIRFGPESQNRSHKHFKEHILGKIGYIHMVHPARAEKLYTLFNRINWN